MPVSLSWRRSGAAAMAKPRDALSVRLCFMDVSNCARLRPFRLSGLVGRVCKTTRESRRRLLLASSRACVLIDVKMNGRSEPLNIKRAPRRFQPGSQTSQCGRSGRAASVPGKKYERLCIAAAASLVMCWFFSSTEASLVPNGGSSVLVLSTCAKAVCRVYVRISLPTIVQLASRPSTTGLCCASSIWAELADVARFAALKTFIQWADRMEVVSGSRTREGTLPADRGASAAAAPAASAATPPPASSVEPPIRGAVVPQAAAGEPSPATVSLSHVSAAEVTGAIGTPPPLRNRRWRGGGCGLALVVLPRPNRGLGGG